jgi:Secretion system C-terminal sorting domain/Right handed beta helix region
MKNFSRMKLITKCVFFLLLSLQLRAADVYVATTGSNSNPGTAALPWKTIQYAVDQANSGTTIYVSSGTYVEKVVFSGVADSGVANSEVILRNVSGQTPVIDGATLTASGREGLISVIGASHIKIFGFELKNFSTGGGNTPCGFYMEGTCANVEFSNNKIHDIKNKSTCADPCGEGAHGIGIFGTNTSGITKVTFDNNEVYNCILESSESFVINGNVNGFVLTNNYVHDNNNIGYDFIGYENECSGCGDNDRARNGVVKFNRAINNTSRKNPWYKNSPSAGGFYVDGGRDILFDGNIASGNDLGFEVASEHDGKNTENITVRNSYIYNNSDVGISIGGSVANAAANKISVINNTFYKNYGFGSEIIFKQKVINSFIQNNIFYANNTPAFQDDNIGSTGNTWSNNLYFNGAAGPGSVSTADPKLVNPAIGNLDLQSTSPAIDKGTNIANNIGTTDIKNNLRFNNITVDIGAHEYGSITLSNEDFNLKSQTNNVHIYPVPVQNELNIVAEKYEDIAKYEVIDLTGKIVLSNKKITSSKTSLDVSTLSQGQYILKAYNRNASTQTARFVK